MIKYKPGDEWAEHYRGWELRINANGDVWWQVYNGTERLHLDPGPDELISTFLELKPTGGRAHVTEDGTVLTRLEDDDVDGKRHSDRSMDDYTAVYVGEYVPDGKLVPQSDSSYSLPVQPSGLSERDLWPSVYDGARYSFNTNGRMWWHNTLARNRHPVDDPPQNLIDTLRRVKPGGGSFCVTPWGDVITLIDDPAPKTVREQFSDLPAVIRNIIKLRRERADLQMLPVYVTTLGGTTLDVGDPVSLSTGLSESEEAALEDWATSLGSTSPTSGETHRASSSSNSSVEESAGSESETSETGGTGDPEEPPSTMDDPIEWLNEDMDRTEERINDR